MQIVCIGMKGNNITEDECEIIGGDYQGDGICKVDDIDGHFKGKFNSMNFGRLVENPTFLFKTEKGQSLYGDFEASTDHLDRTVSMEHDLSLSEQSEFLEKNEPHVFVYEVVDGEVKKKDFYPIKKMVWKEFGKIW